MSTKPKGRATCRITSSVTVEGTPDDFLGHDTHTDASGLSARRNVASRLARSPFAVTNTWARLVFALALELKRTPGGNGWRSASYSAGAPIRRTSLSAVMPSFFASGV